MRKMHAMNAPSRLAADAIRAELARRRISYSTLAAHLGTSSTSISRRLSGDVPIDLNELGKIADFLSMPIAALLSTSEAAQP